MPKKIDYGKELFRRIETTQGYAFVSDGIEGLPKDRVLALAKASLKFQRDAVKILEAFISEFDN